MIVAPLRRVRGGSVILINPDNVQYLTDGSSPDTTWVQLTSGWGAEFHGRPLDIARNWMTNFNLEYRLQVLTDSVSSDIADEDPVPVAPN